MYFIKQVRCNVTLQNADQVLAYGVVRNNILDSMLSIVKNQFADSLLKDTQWPESKLNHVCYDVRYERS